MSFKQFTLDARLMAGIKGAGYTTPTPIQDQAIPQILAGNDVLGLAQTGTGKTAAFMLPILQRLLTGPQRRVRALIIAPTRELAEQIYETGRALGRQTNIRSMTIYGGVSKSRQEEGIRRGAELIIACPGRLLDHLNDGNLDLSQVEVLVLDEADRMCDMGLLPDIRRILKHLPARRQTLFFSATMPDDIRQLSTQILQRPVTVQVGDIAPAETVEHALYPVSDPLKKKLLLALLAKKATGRVLVFTRTKYRARNLARDLAKSEFRVSALQGNMSQNQRLKAINGFRAGKFDILTATDIAARGIDVSEITHVINFDMPDTVEAYTHRIGRTGRAEQAGEAFTFAAPGDEPMIRQIERVLGEPIERRQLPDFDYEGFNPAVAVAPQPHRGHMPQSNRPSSAGNNQRRRHKHNRGRRS